MDAETRAVMLRLVKVLEEIAKATNPESPDENYRADDREGCLDWVFGSAEEAVAAARNLLDAQPAGKE